MVPGNAVESFSDVGCSLQDDLLQRRQVRFDIKYVPSLVLSHIVSGDQFI